MATELARSEVAANKRFLDTSNAESAQDWDDLLRLQVDVLSAVEFEHLQTFEPWLKARSVLDAGCGNGYYLSRLATTFPGREYVGLDISREMIDRARSEDRQGIEYLTGSYFTFDRSRAFDVVVMRLFVQHLADLASLLTKGERVLAPGGGLLIIESDPRQSPIPPELPLLARMLRRFEMITATGGGVRLRLLRDLESLVAEASGGSWRVASDATVVRRLAGPFAGSKLMRVFRLWTDLCERQNIFPYDFDGVRAELRTWGELEDRSCEIAMRLIYLQPAAPAAA